MTENWTEQELKRYVVQRSWQKRAEARSGYEMHLVPATEVAEKDKIDPRGHITVTKVLHRADKVLVAYRGTGTRSGSINVHHEDAMVKVWRPKPDAD